MVSANTSEVSSLTKGFKMVTVLLRREDSTIVADVLLRHNAMIACKLFKVLFRCDGAVGVQRHLVFDVNVPGRMVNKNGTASVLQSWIFAASRVGKATTDGRLEMVHGHSLTREEMSVLEHSGAVSDGSGTLPRGGATLLLAKLARSTQGHLLKTRRGGLKPSFGLGVGKDPASHKKLNAPNGEVAKAVMPSQKLLLGFIEIHVAVRHR
jgi:hypothetical protein